MAKRNNQESPSGSIGGLSGDESHSSTLTTRKRRRLVNASPLDLCQELFDKIRVYRSDDGSLSELFMKLPSRRSNSDYYEAVREPIDLARIQAKIKAAEYESVDQMASDIGLLVANTKAFYPVTTTEFSKAVELQDLFERERQALQTLTVNSAVSTTSSTDSSALGRRSSSRRQVAKIEERDDDEVDSLSIAASDDSHMATSESSTTTKGNSNQQMDTCYELLFAAIANYKTEDGHLIAPTFTHLPSKELYPVYYVVIKEPIDLRMIARRIQSGTYQSMDEIEKDFALLARNAKTFNEPKSSIYRDAVTLARILKGKRGEAEHPPVRTNRERGKRACRLNYVPHEVVDEYAQMPDAPPPPPPQPTALLQEESNPDMSVADEEDDLEEEEEMEEEDGWYGDATSFSCSSTNSTPIKGGQGGVGSKVRGRPRKEGEVCLSPLSDSNVSHPSTTVASRAQRRLQDKLLHAVLEVTNPDGQSVHLPFFRLPSKRLYPDYYDEISHPICLSEIKKRIKRYSYINLEALVTDFDLVFKNAQQYNVEQSMIYQDSVRLQEIVHKKYEELKVAQNALAMKPDIDSTTCDLSSSSSVGGGVGSVSMDGSDGAKRSGSGRRSSLGVANNNGNEEDAIMKSIYKAIYFCRADDGHFPRDSFINLPSRDENPDYYEQIKEPVSLMVIKRKMDENVYHSHQDMLTDLKLMLNNAQTYYKDNVVIRNDGTLLEAVIKKRLTKSLSNAAAAASASASSSPITAATATPPPGVNRNRQTESQPPMSFVQRLMLELFQAVRDYQIRGRVLSNLFMRLPTRSEMPTYYEFIKKPVELQVMAKQLIQGKYELDDFLTDLFLVFDNACKFNEPNSQIYLDALTLHRVCLTKRDMLFSMYESQLSLPPMSPPDIPTCMRRFLTNLHNAMLTACDQDGRGLVDSLIAGDGIESTLTSVTAARLAALHRAVAAGAYRRLDNLQSDWLSILKRARIGEGNDHPADVQNPLPTKQQRLDAAELARRWIQLRDELGRRQAVGQSKVDSDANSMFGTNLTALVVSPALIYTEAILDMNLDEEERNFRLETFADEDGEEVLAPLKENETEVEQLDLRGQTYRLGDFIYIEPAFLNATNSTNNSPSQCHIGRITRFFTIAPPTDSVTDGQQPPPIHIRVAMYLRPTEAHPSKRRRLLAAEVFRTALGETIVPNQIVGRCLVVSIAQFIRCRPKGFEERDTFVCESQFSAMSKKFIKIRSWTIPTPVGVELEPRPTPFIPTRLPPNEPLENALEQSIILEDVSGESEPIQIYEQYVHENGFLLKLGDFLYVPKNPGSMERTIVRVDKLWKSLSQNTFMFSGPSFITPNLVDHLPTRLFYPKEVFFVDSSETATHPLASATGKCCVMRPVDYAQARPTEVADPDVYLCDSKYFGTENVIRKLKKGLKKFKYSNDVHEDEFYFFPQSIGIRKEASPLLAQASADPLNHDQLNCPSSSALACVIAASQGLASPQCLSDPSMLKPSNESNMGGGGGGGVPGGLLSSPTTYLNQAQLDMEMQNFLEANVDRNGKKRKFRKPPSGYVVFAGEFRKKILGERPEAPFGEISREIGLMWRQMSMVQRETYEQKARMIKKHMEELEMQSKTLEHDRIQYQIQQQQQKHSLLHHHQQSKPPVHPIHINHPQVNRAGPNLMPAGPTPPGVVPTAAAPTMQFYQTPTGQVIQIVHATSAPGVIGAQPGSYPIGSGLPIAPATPHQVVYQLANQTPIAAAASAACSGTSSVTSINPAANVQSPFYHSKSPQLQPQRVLMPSTSQPNLGIQSQQQQQQVYLNSSIAVVHPTSNAAMMGSTQAVPFGGAQLPAGVIASGTQPTGANVGQREYGAHFQGAPTATPQYQFVQQVQQGQTVGPMPSIVAQQSSGPSAPGSYVMQAPVGHQSQQLVHNVPTQVMIASQSAKINRPQSPVFVAVPPRTSRVLHSEIYQRYINRLRKNTTGGLSDWQSQIQSSEYHQQQMRSVPIQQQPAQQLASNFFTDPSKALAHYPHHPSGVTEALWNLRDYLLEDTLKIRTQCVGQSLECL